MQGGTCAQFLDKLYDMMDFLLPNYINEGKNQLVVAVGLHDGDSSSWPTVCHWRLQTSLYLLSLALIYISLLTPRGARLIRTRASPVSVISEAL